MAKISKGLKQHTGTNECGAYALASVLHAFNKLPAQKDTSICYAQFKSSIGKGVGGAAAADAIYKVTGIGPGGYNMPSAMCLVAGQLHLSAKASYAKGCGLLTDPKYAPEVKMCANMGFGGKEEAFGLPDANSAQLVCVAHASGLHWLARGDDGVYMDPADASFPTVLPSGYTLAGVWLTFSL